MSLAPRMGLMEDVGEGVAWELGSAVLFIGIDIGMVMELEVVMALFISCQH